MSHEWLFFLYKWPVFSFPCFCFLDFCLFFLKISTIYFSPKLSDRAVKTNKQTNKTHTPGIQSVSLFPLEDVFAGALMRLLLFWIGSSLVGILEWPFGLPLGLELLLDPSFSSWLVCSFILLEHFLQELPSTWELNLLLLHMPKSVFFPLSYVHNLVKL